LQHIALNLLNAVFTYREDMTLLGPVERVG